MKQEHSFTLTVPLEEFAQAEKLLEQAREKYRNMAWKRKTDRGSSARYYLRFPFTSARPDLAFQEWYLLEAPGHWDLFGPTYGRWGLC